MFSSVFLRFPLNNLRNPDPERTFVFSYHMHRVYARICQNGSDFAFPIFGPGNELNEAKVVSPVMIALLPNSN